MTPTVLDADKEVPGEQLINLPPSLKFSVELMPVHSRSVQLSVFEFVSQTITLGDAAVYA